MPKKQKIVSTFGPEEFRLQERFSLFRSRVLRPVLRALVALRISPDMVSMLSLLSLLFLPVGFAHSPWWAIVAFGLHLVFDALDGALAHFTGTASPKGAYVDIVVDHASFIITALTLSWFGIANPFWLLLYTVCYLVLVIHLVIMNASGHPPSFPVVRTKYILYALVLLYVFGYASEPHLDLFFQMFGVYYLLMDIVYILIFRWDLIRDEAGAGKS